MAQYGDSQPFRRTEKINKKNNQKDPKWKELKFSQVPGLFENCQMGGDDILFASRDFIFTRKFFLCRERVCVCVYVFMQVGRNYPYLILFCTSR